MLFMSMSIEELKNDVDAGMSSYDLAKKYNKGQTTIRYWLKKFGLKTNPKSKPHYSEKFYTYTLMDWNRCQMLIDNGMTWRELLKNGFPSKSLQWAVDNEKVKLKTTSESLRYAHATGKVDYSSYRTPEHRKKMSKFGGLKLNAGRCKHIKYTMKDGRVVDIQGTWELKFVEFLDAKGISWDRNRVGYKYVFDGKEKLYFPDFIITNVGSAPIFIEVKGFETDKDRAKWKQFPFPLQIVKKTEIQDLEFWYKKVYETNRNVIDRFN